jgi:hypothetical protein
MREAELRVLARLHGAACVLGKPIFLSPRAIDAENVRAARRLALRLAERRLVSRRLTQTGYEFAIRSGGWHAIGAERPRVAKALRQRIERTV